MADISNEVRNTEWRITGYRTLPLLTDSDCWTIVQARSPRTLVEWRDIAVFATTEDAERAVKAINEQAAVIKALCEILVAHNDETATDRLWAANKLLHEIKGGPVCWMSKYWMTRRRPPAITWTHATSPANQERIPHE